MIKAYKHKQGRVIRRSERVYLNELNKGKADSLFAFLHLCRDSKQYFVDLFWQRQDFSAKLADIDTVHKACNRFGITTRLSQALAKQAKETIRDTKYKQKHKPRIRKHSITLYSSFVKISPFVGSFDFAVRLTGSGTPRMVIPVKSTLPIQEHLKDGWTFSKSIRIGRKRKRLFVEFILEKPKPLVRDEGYIVGMDSNYKNGFVFSDGQIVGQSIYNRVQTFSKRQKNTFAETKALLGNAFNKVNFSRMKTLCIENLKYVKHNKRGKFSRSFNRRLSHWQYAYAMTLLTQKCEEQGVLIEYKHPWKTSQFCPVCCRWDKRSREGDKFCCIHCGYTNHADFNAAQNLALLGVAGVCGLRSLLNTRKIEEDTTSCVTTNDCNYLIEKAVKELLCNTKSSS